MRVQDSVVGLIADTTPHPVRLHDALLGGCDQPASGSEAH